MRPAARRVAASAWKRGVSADIGGQAQSPNAIADFATAGAIALATEAS